MNEVVRSQADILARMSATEGNDFFGFRREVLISALEFVHARIYLKDGVTPEEWPGPVGIGDEARGYLEFAIGKISNHRGLSASRSVYKLSEYAWLLGRDDVASGMELAGYAQYGAPKVRAFAFGMGWGEVWDKEADADVLRMATGEKCSPDCTGCGS